MPGMPVIMPEQSCPKGGTPIFVQTEPNKKRASMKYFLILTALMVGLSAATAQGPVASLTTGARLFESDGNQTITRFTLLGSAEQAAFMQAEAAKYPEMIRLEVAPSAAGRYDCMLHVTGQPEASYVYKLFLSFGIEKLLVDGQQAALSELAGILVQ